MATKVNITSPVGRIVMGSLYDPSTTDAEGKPLVVKTGPNAGQPRVNYFFALAIPKRPRAALGAYAVGSADLERRQYGISTSRPVPRVRVENRRRR